MEVHDDVLQTLRRINDAFMTEAAMFTKHVEDFRAIAQTYATIASELRESREELDDNRAELKILKKKYAIRSRSGIHP